MTELRSEQFWSLSSARGDVHAPLPHRPHWAQFEEGLPNAHWSENRCVLQPWKSDRYIVCCFFRLTCYKWCKSRPGSVTPLFRMLHGHILEHFRRRSASAKSINDHTRTCRYFSVRMIAPNKPGSSMLKRTFCFRQVVKGCRSRTACRRRASGKPPAAALHDTCQNQHVHQFPSITALNFTPHRSTNSSSIRAAIPITALLASVSGAGATRVDKHLPL